MSKTKPNANEERTRKTESIEELDSRGTKAHYVKWVNDNNHLTPASATVFNDYSNKHKLMPLVRNKLAKQIFPHESDHHKLLVKESVELDEASKTTTYTNGNRTVTVSPKNQFGEHVVKFHINGIHQKNADYYTDDTEDAHGTAKHFVNDINELNASTLASYIPKRAATLYFRGRGRDAEINKLSPEDAEKSFKRTMRMTNSIGTAARKLYEPKYKGTKMTEQTIELINAIASNDTIASAQLFNDAVMSRVSDIIDARRQEVAQGMFENESENMLINEAPYNSSAILPASRALHNKNKSSLDDVGDTWKDKMTVLAVKDIDGKKRFVGESGHGGYHKVGERFNAHHDQTWQPLGQHEVENVIHMDGGKVVHRENEIGLHEKRPLYVYK